MWWRQVWLVRMLVMKHWKCNIFPKYCKTSRKTRAVLEAQKKDSLVSGTEERKKWINNLFSLGNMLHQSHWWTREWRKCGLENFLQVWLELWHSCVDAAESTGSDSTTSQKSSGGPQGYGGQVVQYSASSFCTTTIHLFCLNRALDTVLQNTQNISFSLWSK